MPYKRFNREQRLAIYREALKTFRKMAATKEYDGHVTGMCEHIHRAARKLSSRWVSTNGKKGLFDGCVERKNFPEYFSYKPLSDWVDDGCYTQFWWSTKTPKGRERRLRVLEAIAAGKDKSITGNLP